ncbi:phosphoribosyltransferase [Devosia sp. PTR5]|uniref:Phosphoribosyltransferase n=1 Tax=Devosia oryzisoli TaxID=2774138 RepID=A0A927FXQ4_9HYPH|nr:phosphoribosyltransferase [Devosia oryzisoli]MBD8066848.1 phosphoribosyltransferase [Devosia oryzisoli]
MSHLPHEYWQVVAPAGTYGGGERWSRGYPATLPDGREILLPIRVLPGRGDEAVASLIINQASFAVEDAIASAMADHCRSFAPDVIVGVPTLGLPLANNVARRLGHSRMVPLGTSRKFWYEEELSVPLSSITSPQHQKTLYLDPRMLPLLRGKRIVVIDDVISSGASTSAVLKLLDLAGLAPAAIVVGMLQGERWRMVLASWESRIRSALTSPRLRMTGRGEWTRDPSGKGPISPPPSQGSARKATS